MANITEIPNTTQINNAIYIANFFTNMGWTRNAICGLLGNMWQESRLDPGNKESGSTGVGLVQWSEYDGNHVYLNWCNENGYTWSDIDVQLLRLKLEYEWILAGQDAKANWCWYENINMSYEEWAHSTQSADYLAEVFCTNYERPGIPMLDVRKEYATWFYDNLSFEQKEYWTRTERAEYGNPYYNTTSTGGYSDCEVGYSDNWPNGVPGLNTLPNCVGLAWGAFNETYVKNTPGASEGFHYRLYGDGGTIWDSAQAAGWEVLGPEDSPPLGGLIVWSGTANHVAYICEVINNDKIRIHQSGWDTIYSEGDYWNTRELDRNSSTFGANSWSQRGTCKGFVVNPAVGGYNPPEPTIKTPEITNIKSISSTRIRVSGISNGSGQVTLYIKWNSSTVSQSNYDTTVTVSGSSFTINIDKPRRASSVSILPVRGSYVGEVKRAENLPVSIPCINVYNNNKFVQSIPYVYTNGQWREAVPYIYTNGQWREIYNDKT